MVDRLLEGKSYITGVGPYLIPNILIRKKSKKSLEDNYKVLSVEITTCKRCILCVNKCPTFSILFDGKYADPNIYERHRGIDVV